MTGQIFYEVLEASVAKYPAQDGRFPQVSGFKFSFDPRKEPGSRVNIEDIIELSTG